MSVGKLVLVGVGCAQIAWSVRLHADDTEDAEAARARGFSDDRLEVMRGPKDSEKVRSILFDDIYSGIDSFRIDKDSDMCVIDPPSISVSKTEKQEQRLTGPCPESFISHTTNMSVHEVDNSVREVTGPGIPESFFSHTKISVREVEENVTNLETDDSGDSLESEKMLPEENNLSPEEIAKKRTVSEEIRLGSGTAWSDHQAAGSSNLAEKSKSDSNLREVESVDTLANKNEVGVRPPENRIRSMLPRIRYNYGFTFRDSKKKRSKNSFSTGRFASMLRVRHDLVSIILHPHRYGQSSWLKLSAAVCWMFSGGSFYIMYCQFLDAMAIDVQILRSDIEFAQDLIFSPEYTAHCLNSYQTTCNQQYGYASVFGLMALLLAYMGFDRFRDSRKSHLQVHPAGVKPRSTRVEKIAAAVPKTVGALQWIEATIDKYVGMGGRYYWLRSFAAVFFDVALQCARCFLVKESYATTRASQTIMQIVAMALFVDFSMLTFYIQSEVGFMVVTWVAEVAFLFIRWSLSGSLSMRSTGFLDFLTIAAPFFYIITEIFEFTAFIKKAVRDVPTNPEEVEARKKRRGIWTTCISVVVTAAAIAAATITGQKGFHETCPNLDYDIGFREVGSADNLFLPMGMFCFSWQFNLYLDPPCSCAYLTIEVDHHPECTNLDQDPEHAKLQPTIAHVEDVRFLEIKSNNDFCPLINEDIELISTWTNLRMLSVSIDDRSSFPENFNIEPLQELENLIALDISRSEGFEDLDTKFLNSWPRLESFLCFDCPIDDPQDLFSGADLPRLNLLKLYGVDKCLDDEFSLGQDSELICISRNETETCPGVTQFWLEKILDDVKGATRNMCYEPRCSEQLTEFRRGCMTPIEKFKHSMRNANIFL